MFNCERCDNAGGITIRQMVLLGGAHVDLCTRCQRDWHVYLTHTHEDLWIKYVSTKAYLEHMLSAVSSGHELAVSNTEDLYRQGHLILTEIEKEIFNVSLKFLDLDMPASALTSK